MNLLGPPHCCAATRDAQNRTIVFRHTVVDGGLAVDVYPMNIIKSSS